MTAGFAITAIICACGVLAIAWARRRAKSQPRGEAKRIVDQIRPAQVAASTRAQLNGPSPPRVTQSTSVLATADVPAIPATSAEQSLYDLKTAKSAASSPPLELSDVRDHTISEHGNDAQPEPFVPELEVVNALTPTKQVEEAVGLSDALPAITDQRSHTSLVCFDFESARISETRPAPGSSLISHGEDVVPSTESERPLAREELVPAQTRPTHSVGEGHGAPLAREVGVQSPAPPVAESEHAVSPEAIREAEDNDVTVTISTPQYQAPRVNVAPTKREKKRTTSARLPSNQVQRMSVIIKARVHRDYWTFVLLAERPAGAPSELEVKSGTTLIQLVDAGDEWYETPTVELADWLGGVALVPRNQTSGKYQWQLSARDIHVLAPKSSVSGWASATRLLLGRKHLVLCKESRTDEVELALKESGCENALRLSGDCGAPPGWILFWPVIPTRPVPPVVGEELLNILRPLADLEILLEGGLRLESSTWMAGYPPKIRVIGIMPDGESVFVDGEIVVRSDDGEVAASSFNTVQDHYVSVGGRQSCSYSIVEPRFDSEPWQAYEFARGTVCGALVEPASSAEWVPVTVPASNPLLIGAEPGQILLCPSQPGREWTVFPRFEPVWALPSDPLRCNKKRCRVVLLAHRPPLVASVSQRKKEGQHHHWIQAIRDARRKGLLLQKHTDEGHRLWLEYAQVARSLWRRAR